MTPAIVADGALVSALVVGGVVYLAVWARRGMRRRRHDDGDRP